MSRAVAVLLVLLAVAVVPASAHVTAVTASNQTTTNGTVVVDRLFGAGDRPYHLVVHANAGGAPGRPVGHRTVDPGTAEAVRVELDDEFWTAVDGETTLWATLHRDADGDRTFEPPTEPVFTDAFGNPVRDRFVLARGATATVVTRSPTATRTANPVVTATPTVSPATTAVSRTAGTAGDGAGFGPSAALAALIALVAIAVSKR